ncbi:MAG TPA: lysylphosphatidylglycerol synthase domain-containing protein [Acidimicrobiales bacterium]|nr:lysylphosphatidylglycerol synthase domain-containing protein [Acidimicrobiales bacterium]
MQEATRDRLVKAGRAAFAVVLIGVLVLAAIDNAEKLRDVRLQPQPGWALAAIPFTFVGGLVLPLAWRHVLVAYGVTLDRATAVRVWCVSQAGRFVPTGVALVASRLLLASREGVPRSLAGASLAVELGLILIWGAFYTAWLPSYWLPGPLRALLATGAVAVLVALPWLLRVVGRFLPRFPAIAPESLRVRHLYEAIGLYGANDLVRCVGLTLVAASLHTIDPSDLFRVTAAVNLGFVVGMVGITPAGLGVREGVVAALLAPRFGLGTAAAMSVAFRAWDFLFELVWIGIALTWERRTRRAGASADA